MFFSTPKSTPQNLQNTEKGSKKLVFYSDLVSGPPGGVPGGTILETFFEPFFEALGRPWRSTLGVDFSIIFDLQIGLPTAPPGPPSH